jgi:SulP family sulfate permease
MEKVPYLDQSGLYTLEDITLNLRQKDIQVLFVGVQKQPLYLLKKIKIVPDLIPAKDIYKYFTDCVKDLSAFKEERL